MAVVSFERKFIFIKTKKTAGTSMEIALSPHAGKDGIITPISADDELIRLRQSPDALPRNYTDNEPEVEETYRDAIRKGTSRAMREVRRTVKESRRFYNHMPAQLLRERLPEAFWNDAYKFTIERHPYEKVVSRAHFRLGRKGQNDLAALMDDVIAEGDYINFDIYAIDGKVAADKVIRYEELDQGIREVEQRLGIDIAARMPAAKGNFRSDRTPAKDVLNEQQKKTIRKRCAREFELFGYEA